MTYTSVPSQAEHSNNDSPVAEYAPSGSASSLRKVTNSSPPATRSLPSVGRVALAHDYLLVMRGAERTFAAIADLYDEAPIYTLLYDEPGTTGRFSGRTITTSALQRLRAKQANFRRLLPLYPSAIERMRLEDCDAVISSSSAFAHGVRVPDGAAHICYCYTPFRYAWYDEGCALHEVPRPLRPLLRHQLGRIRKWDLAASSRVDTYIAISELSRQRIVRVYGRDAPVVHPPVETHRFEPGNPGDSLLVVSELVGHKRLRVALEAARRVRAPIQIVGSGPNYAELKECYPEAEFLGRASDEELTELYASARAVLVPSIEEFGITTVEAQASGRPVIAAAAGGALETVLDGQTGWLAKIDDVDSFADAITNIDKLDFDPSGAVQNAERFSVAAFQNKLAEQVALAIQRKEEPHAHTGGYGRAQRSQETSSSSLGIAACQATDHGAQDASRYGPAQETAARAGSLRHI